MRPTAEPTLEHRYTTYVHARNERGLTNKEPHARTRTRARKQDPQHETLQRASADANPKGRCQHRIETWSPHRRGRNRQEKTGPKPRHRATENPPWITYVARKGALRESELAKQNKNKKAKTYESERRRPTREERRRLLFRSHSAARKRTRRERRTAKFLGPENYVKQGSAGPRTRCGSHGCSA